MNVSEEMYALGNQGSAIRELFEYGKKRKANVGEDKVYDFSIGNPSIPSPKEVNETLIKLLTEKDPVALHGYTSNVGDNNTRKAISEYLNKTYDTYTEWNLIYMTCGAAASLSITFKALSGTAQDEVIVLAPFFPEYTVFIKNAGLKPVIVQPDSKMKLDFTNLENAISEKTRAIVIDSPNNPTGAVYTEEEIKKISKLLEEKEREYGTRIFLISDEPYREILFEGKKYPFVTNYYIDSIVCYSFSKSISLPGERVGYILINPRMEGATTLFKAVCGAGRTMGFVCAPALFQYMVPSILGKTSDISIYQENRDLLYDSLKEMGYEMVHPDGAFYLFMKALEENASAFSEKAKEYDLLIVPSDSFGVKGYVRLSYCVKNKTIKDSLPAFRKLKEYYDNLKK